jgi:hypothetical protein
MDAESEATGMYLRRTLKEGPEPGWRPASTESIYSNLMKSHDPSTDQYILFHYYCIFVQYGVE